EDWVRLEIERSLARNIPVIPILIGGATLPTKSDLPPSLQPLIDHQCATVTTNGFRHEMAGLARDIAELNGPRRWGRIVGGAALAFIGAAYLAVYQMGVLVWTPWPAATVQTDKPMTGAAADPSNKAEDRERARRTGSGSAKTFQDQLADGKPCPMC